MAQTILVVDDEPNALRLLTYALETAGYHVLRAETGQQALQEIGTSKPDLVILDVMLADISGIEVCQRLRSEPQTVNLPVIMLSALAQVADKVRGLQAGADEYVTKPVDVDEIVARVAAILRRRASVVGQPTVPEAPIKGEIVVVYGPKGGVGRTAIAANLAIALRKLTKKRVLLVDANMQFGDVGVILNLGSTRNILQLLPYGDELDSDVLNSVLAPHSSGIEVLPGSDGIQEYVSVKPADLQRTLSRLQGFFEYVIVDVWPALDECTRAVLGVADKIVLVIVGEMSSLRNARIFLDLARSLEYAPAGLFVTLNRDGAKGNIRVRDVEKVLGCKMAARIPSDAQLVSHSLNRGVPLFVSAPRSLVARSILRLAKAVTTGSGGTSRRFR